MNSLQNPLNANYPQDVTQKPGENAVFIVYALKDLPDTIDKVKDVCANFSALIRSMRNRYPDMDSGRMLGNVSFRSKETPKNCNRLKRSKELSLRLFLPPGIYYSTSAVSRWDCALSSPPL